MKNQQPIILLIFSGVDCYCDELAFILLSHYPYLADLFSFLPTYACCHGSVAMRYSRISDCRWPLSSLQYAYRYCG